MEATEALDYCGAGGLARGVAEIHSGTEEGMGNLALMEVIGAKNRVVAAGVVGCGLVIGSRQEWKSVLGQAR